MALLTGKSGTITDRDNLVLLSLFFCRYLTTRQLERLFFPSASKARDRLARLDKKGYVKNRSIYVEKPKSWDKRVSPQAAWYLTKPGFEAVAAMYGYDETYASKPLQDEGILHHILTNQVYVAAKDELDAELGPYPEWEWRHEKRVFYEGEYANVPYQHKPDAHIIFRGHTFILERQTDASKIGPRKVYDKVRDHKLYVELKLNAPAEVLWAFDSDDNHLIEAAERAGQQHGIRVVAGDVPAIADYLLNSAVRLY